VSHRWVDLDVPLIQRRHDAHTRTWPTPCSSSTGRRRTPETRRVRPWRRRAGARPFLRFLLHHRRLLAASLGASRRLRAPAESSPPGTVSVTPGSFAAARAAARSGGSHDAVEHACRAHERLPPCVPAQPAQDSQAREGHLTLLGRLGSKLAGRAHRLGLSGSGRHLPRHVDDAGVTRPPAHPAPASPWRARARSLRAACRANLPGVSRLLSPPTPAAPPYRGQRQCGPAARAINACNQRATP